MLSGLRTALAGQLTRAELRACAALALVSLLFSGAIFAAMFKQKLVSDQLLHASVVQAVIRTHELPGDFLFYLTTAATAGFQATRVVVEVAMSAVLAAAVAAKVLMSAGIALEAHHAPTPLSRRSLLGLVLAVALLSVAFSLPTSTVYLGQLPPNVWHNPTTIFVMPFVVALFWFTLCFLRDGERKWLWAATVVGALNIAAKPSFVLCVLVVFPPFVLARFGLRRPFWEALAAMAFLALLVGAQYLYIFQTSSETAIYHAAGFAGDANSHVRIQPFHVWSHYSESVPLSLLASLFFPLVTLATYRRLLLQSELVRYALALSAVGVVIFATLAETGVREFHGNFAWQAMMCNYVLFLAVLIRVWELGRVRRMTIRRAAVGLSFGAHVVAGVVFLVYYFAKGTYF